MKDSFRTLSVIFALLCPQLFENNNPVVQEVLQTRPSKLVKGMPTFIIIFEIYYYCVEKNGRKIIKV